MIPRKLTHSGVDTISLDDDCVLPEDVLVRTDSKLTAYQLKHRKLTSIFYFKFIAHILVAFLILVRCDFSCKHYSQRLLSDLCSARIA